MFKTKSGFTIVELLIVIVVIGILAAITIVAYNGIQVRARNNAKMSSASADLRALSGYITATGQNVPGIPVCMPTGTADYNADGTPDCGNVNNIPPTASEKTATNTALAAEKINLSYPTDPLVAGTAKYTGIMITYNSTTYGVNGKVQPYFLYFFLEGNDLDCGNAASIKTDGTQSDPLYKLIPARNYSWGTGYTICAYTLPNPVNL